ncbi:MAG: hypothetical protein AAF685_08820 [Cyanobacteria bacterium P01_C01_bin.89]
MVQSIPEQYLTTLIIAPLGAMLTKPMRSSTVFQSLPTEPAHQFRENTKTVAYPNPHRL